MNDERMPINIYKLDAGYNDKGMNSNELIKDYKRNIHKWYFIAAVDIVFALIIAFVNFKVPDTVMMSLIIYIVVLALLIVSIVRIHGYRLQCRNIKGDLTDEKIYIIAKLKYRENHKSIIEGLAPASSRRLGEILRDELGVL